MSACLYTFYSTDDWVKIPFIGVQMKYKDPIIVMMECLRKSREMVDIFETKFKKKNSNPIIRSKQSFVERMDK